MVFIVVLLSTRTVLAVDRGDRQAFDLFGIAYGGYRTLALVSRRPGLRQRLLRARPLALTRAGSASHMVRMLSVVRAFIEDPVPGRFDDLALAVFRFQYEGNEPYRRFCDRRGRHPGNVAAWDEIPAVPTAAFKHADLRVAGLPAGATFRTSGTTLGTGLRGRHHVADPSIYRAAALRHFRDYVLPDGARPALLVVAPPFAEEPESSLCRMIDWIAADLVAGPARYFVHGRDLDERGLAAALRESEPRREPVLVCGVTHALIRFLDFCRSEGLRFRLPYASRIVDTGGTKGRSRPMSRNGLLRACWDVFGVPGYHVANEYGMTEMCSQFYDDSIRNHFAGRKRDRAKIGPPWVRTRVVSPATLEPVGRGERGLLRHLDLANVASVSALQTEDVGVETGEGFEILGRAEGADERGCALLLEDVTA
jgi:hypothetical protein